jgi:phosphate transport system substrate-binding protein
MPVHLLRDRGQQHQPEYRAINFAAPVYDKWGDAYQKSGGGKVSYRSVGSTDGVKQIIANKVDFAESDTPLPDAELAKEGLLELPVVVGGVVPVVNIPDIKSGQSH